MKKLFLIPLMAVSAAFGYAQTPYWSYSFEGGALTDAIGNDDLTQNGSAMITTADRFSSSNDAVTLNGDYLVGGTTGSGSYSLSLWVKGAVNDAVNRFIADQWSNNYGYRLRLENGIVKATLRFGWTVNNQPYQASSTSYLVSSTDVSDGDWHHIVLTAREYINNGFDYSFEYKLFIDGVEEDSDIRLVYIGSGSNRQHEGLAANSTFTIGSNVANNVSHYENTVDDVAFYKTNLSSAQINEIYTARPAAVVYVDEDATGANDGSSWANAFTDLATAMDYATVIGDELWVAEGTYKPSVSARSEYFTLATGVSLYGGFDGTETQLSQRDWRAHETILSGDLNGNDNANVTYTEATRSENSYRVLFVEGSGTLIDGVVIEGGQANNTNDNNFNRGGALYKSVAATDFTIKNSVIRKNVSNREGTLHLPFQGGSNNSILIESCRFENNFGRYSSGFGSTTTNGGVTEVKVYNSEFYNNLAGNVSAGDGFSGSCFGLFANDSEIDVDAINNTFAYNKDYGTQSQDKAPILLRRLNNNGNNVITADFHNNIFYENESAIGVVTSKAIGLMNRPNNDLDVVNFTHSNTGQVNFQNISVAGTVSNNQNVDPQFVDGPNGDLALLATSTMIDAADGTQLPGTIMEDIAGNTRVLAGGLDIGANESDPNACVATAITQQPSAATACENGSTSFTISASGTNLSYQWKLDGNDLSGETSATLSLSGLTAADEGDYTVVVTGDCGVETSSIASLTVTDATSISVQPSDETICEGDAVSLSVSASGDNLSYQWSKAGTPISGANSATYSIASPTIWEAGDYTVMVGGTCGTVTSNVVTLTVNEATAITTQPSGATICEGGSVSLSVVASGTNLTYLWQYNGSDMNSETASTLDFVNVGPTLAADYTVEVTGACGMIVSDIATLTVNETTAITTQPTDATICDGDGITFSVVAAGDNLSYQWKKGGTPIAAAWSDSYVIGTATIWEAGDYTVEVSGTCGSATSDVATLTVNESTSITTQPTDASICEGDDVSFSVVVDGANLTYQWQLNGIDMNGETAASLDLINLGPTLAGDYTVEVSGACGDVTSDVAELTINAIPAPVISENGGMLETGVYDSYQWYLDGVALQGETNATVAIGAPGDYTVEVTENGCTGTSAPYTPMTVGIEENTSLSITAYPNPFNDILNLNLEAFEGQVELQVMDMTGRVVFTSVVNAAQVQLNLNELSIGTYALSVRGANGETAVSRLIKN